MWQPKQRKSGYEHVPVKVDKNQLTLNARYMWLGFYPSNLAFFPLMKPFEVVSLSTFAHCGWY